jgi:transcriptional regulator with XRE-family HTH domain
MTSQTAELTRFLKRMLSSLGFSQREVERRMGVSRGYLSRLFAGQLDLKIDHVVQIAEAVGVEAEEIFRYAFPPTSESPTPQAALLRKKLEAPAAPAQPTALSSLERASEAMFPDPDLP